MCGGRETTTRRGRRPRPTRVGRSAHIHSSLGIRFPTDFGTKTGCGDGVGSLGEGSFLVIFGGQL